VIPWGALSIAICLASALVAISLACAFLSLPNPIKIAALAALEFTIIGAMVLHIRFHKQEMEKLLDE